ncbi:DNA alkylation repair protein [Jannaschia pohangensis]|uniref:DNA alkylation repair enzyme n=1 Tax=Jannaschia pohangensis TaxID=390807 RepID=A0A1I3Q6Y4_9RHOB|nr:DNA alkylation repair protein [Jannaschia pohangensis]SFJ29803.1 DNA alkylation repair enzyme [Jannaschia pohangensis]
MSDAETPDGTETPNLSAMLAARRESILTDLRAAGDADRAARDRAANRTQRETWGVSAETLNETAKALRDELSVDHRVIIADALWRAEVFDARMLACKMMTQARIRPDDGVWARLTEWVFQIDCRALSEAAAAAMSRRVMADLSRLDVVAGWTDAANPWVRRTALAAATPLAKTNRPTEAELAARERVIGWIAAMADDARPVIRQAVDGWLRDLARHDPDRVAAFRETGA